MKIENKITAAVAYVNAHMMDEDAVNDASNIYADSYDEYCTISKVLETIFA